MSKPDLISLQGEWFAAKIVGGVAGALLPMGDTPETALSITSETTDHYTSKDGSRAKDFVLRKAVGVSGNMTVEELLKQNRDIVFSGVTSIVEAGTVADISLGTVTTGAIVDLGHRNLSDVVFKSGDTPIDKSTYQLDPIFGTVIFNTAPSGAVTWSATTGQVERTSIATQLGNEYALKFKGIDTVSGDHISVDLWRVQFSPETEFALINEDFGSFNLEFECLADALKGQDPTLGPFGIVERFKATR